MTTAAPMRPVFTPGTRPLPLVVYFDADQELKRSLPPLKRFRRITFDALAGAPPEVEWVVLVTRQEQMESHYDLLRKPNVRVIAISSSRFKEPRMDGAVYAYLPQGVPGNMIERMVDNAIDHIQLLTSRREVNDRLAHATKEIHDLNQIGAALSAEHDTGKLLEMILTKCREITSSDAGSLYLVEDQEKGKADGDQAKGELPTPEATAAAKLERSVDSRTRLRFKLAQNDTAGIPFKELTMEISEKSIAGYVALTGESVNIEDAYKLPPGVPFKINRKFDEDSGYRTKSILAVPMKNQKDEIVGVLQLINRKRDTRVKLSSATAISQQVLPFDDRQRAIVQSLASQAAVALENSHLYQDIHRLFEGFVRASVIAIEARDPTTSGHSFRVANLTVALAEAVDRCDAGQFRNIRFSRDEMKEIRYASLLHDFGKVAVREEVLVKARKLYPAQMELIKERFQFVKRSMEAEVLRSKLKYVLDRGREQFLNKERDFNEELERQYKELDAFFETILRSNEPNLLPNSKFENLVEVAARRYFDLSGDEKSLLTGDEVRLLSIPKGSLDEEERRQIESHVIHTFNFLQQIPWTREIRSVPQIARGHHEKLNGRGYPYKLSAPEIPIETRMMTISDIFDALSAADRPYKKAVTLERALEILDDSVKDGEIDAGLFRMFKEAQVWQRWKIEPPSY